MYYKNETSSAGRGRPIENAAAAVEAAAAKAKDMLEQLQRGRLWGWLTAQPPQKPNG